MSNNPTLFRIFLVLQTPRALLHLLLLKTSSAKSVIEKDIERWLQASRRLANTQLPAWMKVVWLLWKYPEFRNLFYYRLTSGRRLINRLFVEIAKFFFKPMDTLFIACSNIGEGLFIQHGFSTIIAAKSIGKNCWINQQVTIGFTNETDTPTLGDNVRVTAGAKVMGNITVGDNSIIGANAVVVKNVPPNCTVVGVPGYIVKRDGKKVRESL